MDGDAYIIRIYRREPGRAPGRRRCDGVALVGTVEDAQGTTRRGFHDIEGLWAALARTRSSADSNEGGNTP